MTPAIEVRDVGVALGGRPVLDGLSFTVPAGQVTGLLGPSGCGKTTLMRCVVGVQRIDRGEVRVLGMPAGSPPLRRRVGYVTQTPSVYGDLSARDNARYFAALYGTSRTAADRTLDEVGLADRATQMVSTLSGGERARVSLACALLAAPELLVLDEPTVGLDPLLRQDLWTRFHDLAAGGTTLFVSSHVMFLVTSVSMLRERTSGTLERLLTTPMAKLDLLLGYGIAFAVAATAQAAVTCGTAYGLLGLYTPGSPWLVAATAILGAVLGMALGLLSSAFATTEFQAVQFMPAIVMPQVLLGGLFVPREDMAGWLQTISDALPLTYSIDALSEVGRTSLLTDTLLRDLGVMIGATVAALVLGAFTLRRRSGTLGPAARTAVLADGTVVVDSGFEGNLVTAGAELAVAYDLSAVRVTARIDETAIGDVHVGQPVDIHVDAYPDVTFAGNSTLIPGMSVTVRIRWDG